MGVHVQWATLNPVGAAIKFYQTRLRSIESDGDYELNRRQKEDARFLVVGIRVLMKWTTKNKRKTRYETADRAFLIDECMSIALPS